MGRKIEIDVPPELIWVLEYYEKKSEIRNQLEQKLPADRALAREFLISLEQYAIQGIRANPDFENFGEKT